MRGLWRAWGNESGSGAAFREDRPPRKTVARTHGPAWRLRCGWHLRYGCARGRRTRPLECQGRKPEVPAWGRRQPAPHNGPSLAHPRRVAPVSNAISSTDAALFLARSHSRLARSRTLRKLAIRGLLEVRSAGIQGPHDRCRRAHFNPPMRPNGPGVSNEAVRRTCSRCGQTTDRRLIHIKTLGLCDGDVLTVTRLDRLARSTRDLLNTLGTIAIAKAGFRSLGDTWADTTTSHGRLMLTVLGGLAELSAILSRANRRRPGARRGAWREDGTETEAHPAPASRGEEAPTPGKESIHEIAQSYNVHNSTISRLAA